MTFPSHHGKIIKAQSPLTSGFLYASSRQLVQENTDKERGYEAEDEYQSDSKYSYDDEIQSEPGSEDSDTAQKEAGYEADTEYASEAA